MRESKKEKIEIGGDGGKLKNAVDEWAQRCQTNCRALCTKHCMHY